MDLQRQLNEMDSRPVRQRTILKAANWMVEQQEINAAYQIDTRLRAVQALNAQAVDAIIDLDDYITERAIGRDPAVVSGLRQLQQVTASCASQLVFHYMARPLDM